jgi:hypothetical protein
MKKFLTILTMLTAMFASTAYADHIYEGQTFYGGWIVDNNRGGSEYMLLGNGNGRGLELRGSDRFCVRSGASYATMRSRVKSNRHGVKWWVDEICSRDSHVRVCVESSRGSVSCSTYRDRGWVRFD